MVKRKINVPRLAVLFVGFVVWVLWLTLVTQIESDSVRTSSKIISVIVGGALIALAMSGAKYLLCLAVNYVAPKQKEVPIEEPFDPVNPPSYHDLHITAAGIKRTALSNLPYNIKVTCCRAGGWEAWRMNNDQLTLIGGEYAEDHEWLVLDVAGRVICDSREGDAYV